MCECLRVPDATGVKDETFVRLGAPEDQILIKRVVLEQNGRRQMIGLYFLQIAHVHVDSLHIAERRHLVEADLLGVGQQLGVEREEPLHRELAGQAQADHEEGQREQVTGTREESEETGEPEVVDNARAQKVS